MTGGSFLLSKMTAVRYEVAEHNRMYGVSITGEVTCFTRMFIVLIN